MKTKTLTVIALLSVFGITSVVAQTKERGLFVEMNAGFGNVERHRSGYGLFVPRIGYQLGEKWAVGVKARFETSGSKGYTAAGAYVQYAFWKKGKLKLFTEGELSYNVKRAECDFVLGRPTPRKNYAEAGFTFGGSYALCRNLNVMARYLYIGYNDYPGVREGAYIGNGRGIVDANWHRLQVGLQCIF
ncbi:hypothetical protein [Bacteroides heparinolyticus]|uniref:hypothetical protein n=1 Tax=Prevotella heparinolytica TaxID=28113 RepID=UPI0023F7206E|nr:hypothetical protein [Bacteroides heparinolyticus]MCI6212512.1 hypothetical protein [Bacteroides heparinolyticus]